MPLAKKTKNLKERMKKEVKLAVFNHPLSGVQTTAKGGVGKH